eukprot:scaffold9079_cov120-Cylindrotheca_fusiformis.AAC.7
MATTRYNPEAYGYEDATPDVAARQGYNGQTFTPPRKSADPYGYSDAPQHVGNDMARPRYTPPISRHGMERQSSYQGSFGVDISGINLNDYDNATTLSNNNIGPRRATMSFGEPLNAPPGFGAGSGSRSRSGSDDSDVLTALISPDVPGQPNIHRRGSLQEGIYAVTEDVPTFRTPRRNSLQEALARNNSSAHDPPHVSHHHNANQGLRRSSLQHTMAADNQRYAGPQRSGSMGGSYGGRTNRYDGHSAGGYHAAAGSGGYAPSPRQPTPTGPFYTVKLKRNQRTFVLGPRIKTKLVTGTYVKVEADRGEDLGIVIGEASPDQLEPTRRSSYGGFEPTRRGSNGGRGENNRDQPKKILRLATKEEVALLATRRQEELEMHQLCMQKVRERGLDMRIVDAEYQFDRNKLTFYFEAERRVDFRDLVRELFMICGTRIWMCQINTYATSTASRPATEAPHEEEDNNVPIIAPPSEFLG